MLTNRQIQLRHSQVWEPSLKARETDHLEPFSEPSLCQVDEGNHHMRNIPILWLRSHRPSLISSWQYSNQAAVYGCVCSVGAGFHSAVFAEINPASPVVPDTRRCPCQLSATPLRFARLAATLRCAAVTAVRRTPLSSLFSQQFRSGRLAQLFAESLRPFKKGNKSI